MRWTEFETRQKLKWTGKGVEIYFKLNQNRLSEKIDNILELKLSLN